MLANFISANRDAIVALTRARVASRASPKATKMELANGIPLFMDQLEDALRLARTSDVIDHEQINVSAGRHGHELLRMGLTIGQVVHDYGDVCQAITELAVQQDVRIGGNEFRTLNLCLDDAIAGAVTEYARLRERAISDKGTERLGILAHELRNALNSAMLSYDIVRKGQVSAAGSTGLVLGRSLLALRNLIDRSLASVRLDAKIQRPELFSVAEFIEEIEIGASMQAKARDIHFDVISVDRTVTIEADRDILAAAVFNLLQNAFKFTHKQGRVSLTIHTTTDRVLIDIEDECGGLPPGKAEELFRPFAQRGADRSGLGLGLAICHDAAKASGGEIRVHDLPGKGCVFTLDLPRKVLAPSVIGEGKRETGTSGAAPRADTDGG